MSENLVVQTIFRYAEHITNNIALDIGANHGRYTKILAEMRGIVVAFEPHEGNMSKLKNTCSQFKNVIFEQMAVGDLTGITPLYLCQNEGGYSISKIVAERQKWGHHVFNNVIVRSTRLDDYFNNNENVGFMKIDVEGAEEKVLRGAENILRQNKIVIALETHDTIDTVGIFNYMTDLGYSFYQDNGVHKLDKICIDTHYMVTNK